MVPGSRSQEGGVADAGCFTTHGNELKDSVTAGVIAAVKVASERGEVVVVCGSVFLMSDARAALGLDEPRDAPAVSEVLGAHFKSAQESFGGK